MSLRIGEFYKKKGVIFKGLTHECAMSLDDWDAIKGMLESKDIARLHKFVKSYVTMEDGLDGYCPECDKVYCKQHIRTRVVMDDGFYDCTYGTCPEGHERIIDD
jgi:hypothetical protein